MYDVTRRDTFEDLEQVWMKEVEMYSTVEDAIRMVVANKTDLVGGDVGWTGIGVWQEDSGGAHDVEQTF